MISWKGLGVLSNQFSPSSFQEKMKVAIYCRVSKKDNSQTTENQKVELVKYAKAMGYDFEVFEEQESTRNTRPLKNQLFQEAIRRQWDLILVWKLDRWARSLKELINDLDILHLNKVQFFSLKDNLRIDDSPVNKLMLHILGAFAEFERNILSERIKAGQLVSKNREKIGKRGKDKRPRRKLGYLMRGRKQREKVSV